VVRSMTGFGRGQASDGGYIATAEVRSVNSRYLEASIRLPRALSLFESKVNEIVQRRLSRGKVNVTVTLETSTGGSPQEVRPDLELAEGYYRAADALKRHLGMTDEITLNTLLRNNDLIVVRQAEIEDELSEKLVSEAVNAALDELESMRQSEGDTLARDFRERLDILSELLVQVEKRAPERIVEAKTRLEERITKLLGADNPADEQRLAQEIAIVADRYDITEECVRFRSHIEQFGSLMNEEQPGRRLNFLLQELNREVNTIGSKANDADIAHVVVQMKEEIERVREQVQNIE